jgi:predicted MFS family arabinose efflux permease
MTTTQAPPGSEPRRETPLSPRLVLVFAAACGLAVANNYYAQPLLAAIARTFHSGSATAGLTVTLTQVGYVGGLALLAPLGDLLDRRRLVTIVLGAAALALLTAALSPSLGALAAASLLVGVTSVAAQILVPFAANLAPEEARGRIVGTVMSGLLLGILLARTFAGIVGQIAAGVVGPDAGWRVVYGIAVVLMLGLCAVLWRVLPGGRSATATDLSYGALLRSIGTLVREEPALRLRCAYGALSFAAFSVFWTSIAFHLARPPFGYAAAVIGLFGLAGVAGALCASVAGRLADRGLARTTTGLCALVMLVSYGLLALGDHLVWPLIVGVVLLDLGVQGIHITNQSLIYRLRPEARSRLTTAYMTTYFVGGALGSAGSALAFAGAGWPGVCLLGAVLGVLALALWLAERLKR